MLIVVDLRVDGDEDNDDDDHNADDCNLGVIFGTSNDTLREIAHARKHMNTRTSCVHFVYAGNCYLFHSRS